MKRRTFLLSLATIVIPTFPSNDVYAYCMETGPGGELTPGRISRAEFESLLDMLAARPIGTALFFVQNNKGYYAKICNEPDQIRHFEQKFHPGKWKGPRHMQRDEIYDNYDKKNVVIKVVKAKAGFDVYEGASR